MSVVYGFEKARKQKDRWGLTSNQLLSCSLYKLILQFVKATKEFRLDPFDEDLAMWVEDLSKVVLIRCKNEDLKNEAKILLHKGVWGTYSSHENH